MNKSFKQSINIFSKITNPTRTFTSRTINMQNNAGQGASHATGGSHVPESVQKKAPAGLEESLPNPIHDTTGADGQDTQGKGVSHAVNKPGASHVPERIQKAVPEKLERALPNAIHDTGDK